MAGLFVTLGEILLKSLEKDLEKEVIKSSGIKGLSSIVADVEKLSKEVTKYSDDITRLSSEGKNIRFNSLYKNIIEDTNEINSLQKVEKPFFDDTLSDVEILRISGRHGIQGAEDVEKIRAEYGAAEKILKIDNIEKRLIDYPSQNGKGWKYEDTAEYYSETENNLQKEINQKVQSGDITLNDAYRGMMLLGF